MGATFFWTLSALGLTLNPGLSPSQRWIETLNLDKMNPDRLRQRSSPPRPAQIIPDCLLGTCRWQASSDELGSDAVDSPAQGPDLVSNTPTLLFLIAWDLRIMAKSHQACACPDNCSSVLHCLGSSERRGKTRRPGSEPGRSGPWQPNCNAFLALPVASPWMGEADAMGPTIPCLHLSTVVIGSTGRIPHLR